MTSSAVRGERNYTVLPASRPALEPEPEPERPGRCPQAVLNHPALTGMDPRDLHALAAALDVPYGARREQRNYILRGHRRVNAVRNGDGPNGHRRIDLTGHLIAFRLREHLRLPVQAIGVLPGTGPSTVSHATALTTTLLAGSGIPQPATTPPPDPSRAPPASCWTTPLPPEPPSPSRTTARPCPDTSGHQARTYDTPGVNNRRGLFAKNWPQS